MGQSPLGSDSAGQLNKEKIASPLPPIWFSGRKNKKRSPKPTSKIYGSPIYDDKNVNLGHDDHHLLSFDAAVLSVSQDLDRVRSQRALLL